MATEEELTAAEDSLIADITSGVDSFSVDGVSVRAMDPKTRLEVLDAIRTDASRKHGHRGIRFTKLIPPGGGGSP